MRIVACLAVGCVMTLAAGGAVGQPGGAKGGKGAKAPTLPDGWVEYRPPEKDFVVFLPGEPNEAEMKGAEDTQRLYGVSVKHGYLSIAYSVGRKGLKVKEDETRTLRLDPAIVKGTLKEIKLGPMVGIEFQRNEPEGKVNMYRVLRAKDGTSAVRLMVRDVSALTPAERTAFFESFRFEGAK